MLRTSGNKKSRKISVHPWSVQIQIKLQPLPRGRKEPPLTRKPSSQTYPIFSSHPWTRTPTTIQKDPGKGTDAEASRRQNSALYKARQQDGTFVPALTFLKSLSTIYIRSQTTRDHEPEQTGHKDHHPSLDWSRNCSDLKPRRTQSHAINHFGASPWHFIKGNCHRGHSKSKIERFVYYVSGPRKKRFKKILDALRFFGLTDFDRYATKPALAIGSCSSSSFTRKKE